MNIADALTTQETFNRAQVAWLMSEASRWGRETGYEDGYEAGRRDELALAGIAAAYAHTGDFNAENTWRGSAQRQRRQESDSRTAVTAVRDLDVAA